MQFEIRPSKDPNKIEIKIIEEDKSWTLQASNHRAAQTGKELLKLIESNEVRSTSLILDDGEEIEFTMHNTGATVELPIGEESAPNVIESDPKALFRERTEISTITYAKSAQIDVNSLKALAVALVDI